MLMLCRKAHEMIARGESYRAATRQYRLMYNSIRCETMTQANLQTRLCKHFLRSRSNWFTDICISQWLSHFAALFIVPWAKTLNVKSKHFQCLQNRMYVPLHEKWGCPATRSHCTQNLSSKRLVDTISSMTSTTSKGCDASLSCE